MNVFFLKEHGRVKARVPIVGGDDMTALGQAITRQGVDAIDELHEREQRGGHTGGTMLCFPAIPIKRNDKTSDRAVQTELFEMILERFGRIEATTAMHAPIPARAFV